MEKRLHLLETFQARGNDGASYTVRGYEHLIRPEGSVDMPESWEPAGVYEYRLSSGEAVQGERNGTFSVVGTPLTLVRERMKAAA